MFPSTELRLPQDSNTFLNIFRHKYNMQKSTQRGTPTEPVNRATRFRRSLVQLQHRAIKTGSFLRSLQKPAANTFCRFKKPMLIGAVGVALATTLSSVDNGAPVVQQVDVSKAKKQLLDSAQLSDILGIKTSLDKGAPVDSRNQLGETPFIIVSGAGKIPHMQFLISSGADINAQDNAGWTALIGASRNGHSSAAKFLLGLGADPNISNNSGETPLFWVAARGNNELAIELIKHGANPDIRNKKGSTPLMQAAGRGHLELCRTLLSAGTKVNRHDREGRTAMDYAHMHGFPKYNKVRRLLSEYNAKTADDL
jgi:hypothetical protein